MSKEIKNWAAILDEYKGSGISQRVFCKTKGLSYNQFQYRWYLYNLAKRVKANRPILENNAAMSAFEPVTITSLFPAQEEEMNHVAELAIHFPNQIRCDVKMDLRSNTFATLLKQLVSLC